MKKKTWLFIIVLIVFIINISFFILVRLAKVDKVVQTKISEQLSELLNAEIKIEEFTFNDKQAKIGGIEIDSADKFNLKVNQLYVEYNLPKLIFSKFKNLKAITHIKIYNPEFSLQIKPDGSKKENSEFIIPDITAFFKMLDIYQGKFSINFENEVVQIENSWQDIELSIKNTRSSDITLSAISDNGSNLNVSCNLSKGIIKKVDLKLNDLKPSKLEISKLNSLGLVLDAELSYTEEKLMYSSKIKNIHAEYLEKQATVDSILISGNSGRTYISLHNSYLDNNKIEGSAVIYDILTKDRTINSKLTTSEVSFTNYIKEISGNVQAKADVTGKIANPTIKVSIKSDKLIAAKQEITDIDISAIMFDSNVKLQLTNSIWENNKLIGEGYYKIGEDLHLDLNSHDMHWQNGDLLVTGDLTSSIKYQEVPEILLDLKNLSIKSKKLEFNDLTLKANLLNNDLTADITHPLNDIGISCFGNIKDMALKAKLKLRGLDLSNILKGSALPILTGDIEIDANEYSIVTNSNIMVYDRDYGKLGGRLKTDIVFDLSNNSSLINIRTYNAKYNYEPFKIDLLAKGTLDSLQIKHFMFNKMIDIKGWVRREPEFTYNLSLLGEEIKIKELSKYFMAYDTSRKLDGNIKIIANIDNLGEGNINGNISLNNFKIGDIEEIHAGLSIQGNSSMIGLRDGYIKTNERKIIGLQGALITKPEIIITANGIVDSLQLRDILPQEDLNGVIKGGIEFSRSEGSNELQLDVEIKKLEMNRFKIDLLKLDLLQRDSLLHVNDVTCYKRNEFDLRANGAIGYNLLNSEVFSDTNNISIKFDGDMLKVLADQTKAIVEGSSNTNFDFKVGTKDSKIYIEKGSFTLSDGFMKVKGQPEDIDKISIKFDIKENIFLIDKFKFRMGDGRCYITNIINNTNDDFILGTLNLGKILIRTDEGGVLFNMPGYIPENNVAKVIITGRNSEHFEALGPFEDIKLLGDLNISNGGAIFPPNTENLLKLFNTVREKKASESATLPLSFDIMVNFGENVKYVTYPVDIKINPGGYLNLVYANDEFTIPDAMFIAEEGSVDIFGTKMTLDYMQIQLSRFTAGANISGTFYKKTADGSLITLNIYNEVAGDDDVGTLRFSLNSDNPTDRITDILAKLRYNRAMEEISPDQKKTLLQDEVIQIAGMGLESAIMDPLLSPVENWIRKTLKLDYFHLQTDLVQNLFASYSSDNKSQYEVYDESNEFAKFSSELFLNNLSISVGRYITRDLFLDYETRVEKSQDIALQSEMGIFHEFSLRYQLPYKFRILYRYKIMPFTEENPHEIILERSFRF
ncbi:MAG: hypothetical protein P9L95_01230 [Candidatus Tenebribacter mawsonii]|nr:hypothetical protein [Candidatus Tenebribacter mawsonii]